MANLYTYSKSHVSIHWVFIPYAEHMLHMNKGCMLWFAVTDDQTCHYSKYAKLAIASQVDSV